MTFVFQGQERMYNRVPKKKDVTVDEDDENWICIAEGNEEEMNRRMKNSIKSGGFSRYRVLEKD